MEPTLNIAPATPADLAAFQAEYNEWLDMVAASMPLPEPSEGEDEDDDGSNDRSGADYADWDCYEPEDDCPLDGDAESALASAGFGTDEDYGCYGGDEF